MLLEYELLSLYSKELSNPYCTDVIQFNPNFFSSFILIVKET